MEQLIVGPIGDPDIAVRGTPMPIRPKNFSLKGEIALGADRTCLEIHHEDFAVEAADPDLVPRTAVPQPTPSMPIPVKPVIGARAGFRWANSGYAAAGALIDAGLRAGHPVLSAPEVALGIEHEPTGRSTRRRPRN